MRRTLSFLFSLFFLNTFCETNDCAHALLTDENGRYREHNVDFEKMLLDVSFKPKEGIVMGKVTYQFRPIQPNVDTLFLDAPGIKIKTATMDGKPVSFSVSKAGVTLHFPTLNWNKTYSISIAYEATPRKGLYFVGWNDELNKSRKQIWSQGQGIDNRCWFPCYDDVDDKLITETKITFDKAYTVISNGKLLDSKLNPDSSKTWHYAMTKPHAVYLVMIAIDKYAYKDVKSSNGIASRQYYYSDRPETADATYQYSKEMMEWLPTQTGVPYQWETYANVPVQEYMHGAMENTSATIYTDTYLQTWRESMERPYVATNAHELTHQWFGDYITEWSGTHHWLHESFATYYAKQFQRHIYGEDKYEWVKHIEATNAIRADLGDRFPVAHSQGGQPRHYPKGSFVIDMIRYVVGDSVFQKTIQEYLKKHAFQNVDTHDFWLAFMKTSGMNLDWFFDEWIYRSGVPKYNVSMVSNNGGNASSTYFVVKQIHPQDSLVGLFKMPIVFRVYSKDGSMVEKKAWIEHAEDTVFNVSPTGMAIDYVLFDPGMNVLKTYYFPRSYPMLITQANKAKNMIDRWEAIHALRDTAVATKRLDYINVAVHEKSEVIVSEILHQLGKDKSAEVKELFKKAMGDKDFLVRRSALENIDSITPDMLPFVEKLLKDTSYITIETALRKLCRQYPANTAKYLQQVKGVNGIAQNVRIAWLELSSDSAKQTIFADSLIDLTSHSYEFKTRTKAIETVERLNYANNRLVNNLFDAVLSPNNRLSNPSVSTLKKLMQTNKYKEMARVKYETSTWLDWQKDILKPLFE